LRLIESVPEIPVSFVVMPAEAGIPFWHPPRRRFPGPVNAPLDTGFRRYDGDWMSAPESKMFQAAKNWIPAFARMTEKASGSTSP
jgi:hypothetical protein